MKFSLFLLKGTNKNWCAEEGVTPSSGRIAMTNVGYVSHPELVKSVELTTRSSEARNGRKLPTAVAVSSDHIQTGNAHAFYHQQQLNELKKLAAGDPRPVLEIYDELASNASTSLKTAAHFPTWEQAQNTMYLQPFEEIPMTSGQAAGSATYCRADDNEIRCAVFNVSFADQ
ncbi:hypothetical protein T07_13489 [Trichinella nelsoni]|uniref:Uncharacterized protein n=1 Tax=Trichinella nelsoni TaxID=6336 RepID=A0A0V0RZY4_9BILA|nr:hypothetical protein T07_13489 [Trichinella nelsoni]